MRKFSILLLPVLAFFPSIISACEEVAGSKTVHSSGNFFMGFLWAVALVVVFGMFFFAIKHVKEEEE